ncbi:putative adam family of metalloprotease adm-b [Erysiphe necator]|uniref:Disintegrin and metalloproteinase domain-containing protein B n=1 Tax=Uncinula necator TaxID=52586 RepID=A0A0B1PCS6_UNCNE|nr:putative adam family of metalloprotease adm-b [Erysiphe necator]
MQFSSLRSRYTLYAITLAACVFGPCLSHSIERNPLRYYTTIENAHFNTQSYKIHAASKFELTFELHDGKQMIRLTLSPNNAVIQEGATVQYMAPDGSLRKSEILDRSEYRVFKGDAWIKHQNSQEWTNVGWARIIVLRDGEKPLFEGVFRLDGDHHHIQTSTNFMQTRHRLDPELKVLDDEYLVVWRDSDISQNVEIDNHEYIHQELKRSLNMERSCLADGLSFNTQLDHPIYRGMSTPGDQSSLLTRLLQPRQMDGQLGGNSAGVNLVNSIGSTSGCPTTRRVALVGVATDCTYTAGFNSTTAVRANIINVINSASQVYESSFNIMLGLQNLTISDASCPIVASSAAPWNIGCSNAIDIQGRLNLFSAWRGQRKDNNAYWTLLSTCGTGPAVGLAWLGQLCVGTSQTGPSSVTSMNETVSGANVVVRTGTEWQVVAHETGHTFGAVHDCTAKSCTDGKTVVSQQCCPLSTTTCDAGGSYIMNPNTSPKIQIFSPCSVGNICSAIGRNSVKTNCLTTNKDITTITGSQCGNGIVESGEDCDCGGSVSCGSNPCCNPTTCKFQGNAVCDPSNEDCCSSSCQFKPLSAVCRPSTGSCDPEETCSGTSGDCPADLTAPDGTKCGNSSSLTCASGQCTSRDLQCKTLMGVFTQGNDTYACSKGGCQISCASPEFGADICYSMQQNFLDGTPCQASGKCVNGQCQGASVTKEITSWIDQNKTVVILLGSAFGFFIALTFASYCINICSRARRRRRIMANVSHNDLQSHNYHKQFSVQDTSSFNTPLAQVSMQDVQNSLSYGKWDDRGNLIQQPRRVKPGRMTYG